MAEKKESVFAENGQPSFEGLSQYCPPHCYELDGRELKLVMDNGYDYLLHFGRETVEWGVVGEAARTDGYVALKADDTTYFINAEITGTTPRTGIVLILDDIISTGVNIMDTAREMRNRQASTIIICCTFGLFVSGFDKFIQARTGDKGLDPPYRIEEIILTPAVKLG